MNNIISADLIALGTILDAVKQQGETYLQQLDQRSTSTGERPEPVACLPPEGEGTLHALNQFNDRFEKIIVASSGPRFWGFVTGGSTPASIAGDWLTSIYDQNPQGEGGRADVSALIEKETIELLLDLFRLPRHFLGGFVTGATMSNFTGLAVGRQWIGKQFNKDFAKQGVVPADIKIFTATPHSSAVKSLSMLGTGSANFSTVKTVAGNRESLDIVDLEEKIQYLNGQPFILISSAGTVNTVDFDDFEAIGKLKNKYRFWWHIDAAFGGFAACSPLYEHLLKGWENADSIAVDCHKWLNVPYENAFYLVREEHQLLQLETFQNSNAPYLGDPLVDFNYLNFLPENSRRLKALPVWFSLMAYGKSGYKDIVEQCVSMARLFGNFIDQEDRLILLAPVRLNTVCFTLKDDTMQSQVDPFLALINSTGKVYMTPAVYGGKKAIRAAFVNFRTTANDIRLATETITTCLQKIFERTTVQL